MDFPFVFQYNVFFCIPYFLSKRLKLFNFTEKSRLTPAGRVNLKTAFHASSMRENVCVLMYACLRDMMNANTKTAKTRDERLNKIIYHVIKLG